MAVENLKLYEDIAERTSGDIYIGVVGPVRTGKSTFIKRFMETLVIPGIDNVYMRERARDELPQSGSGRTIMTAEPKFVPEDAVDIGVGDGVRFRVRLIDCVGYLVDGAVGQFEDDAPRMVQTPWSEDPIPMTEAAEIGTRKVIREHSTIGIVITTDGSITDIAREDYIEAENRVIAELKELGKPFLVLVNSADPESAAAKAAVKKLREEHDVTCLAANCLTITEADVQEIIKGVLFEFPAKELGIFLPPWVDALPYEHPIKKELFEAMLNGAKHMRRIRDVEAAVMSMRECTSIESVRIEKIDMGTGATVAHIGLPREMFYTTLTEQSGFEISDEGDLMTLLQGLSKVKTQYDRVSAALDQVRETGYGIVMPATEELTLEQPEIVRQGGRYGVRLRASAPSIHMLRADIETEVSPIVGDEKQSEDLIHYLLSEFEDNPVQIWQSNIFGKSLHDLVSEGLVGKLKRMPDDARTKIRETLERIINEGSGGLICIIL
ncbi:stage IV sporulation protein A [Oscillospiraceae bacterium OttesenSCG-928-F05]|nr:stage IV sporulation protein A [Oscillospiraceae bacterium OttesenSCG-928-F05]